MEGNEVLVLLSKLSLDTTALGDLSEDIHHALHHAALAGYGVGGGHKGAPQGRHLPLNLLRLAVLQSPEDEMRLALCVAMT